MLSFLKRMFTCSKCQQMKERKRRHKTLGRKTRKVKGG